MIKLVNGDCVEAMRDLPDASIDAVVSDPPYELGFMGKGWDASGIAYNVEMWRQVLRVLKLGGHLLAFGGTRTYHRMACAIEDAGFEIRDSIHWVYGSGFPKSHNLDGEWDGWGTALKPAHEPIVVARKPLIGTVAENVEAHGTGALNIDGCRVAPQARDDYGRSASNARGTVNAHNGFDGKAFKIAERSGDDYASPAGRWPPNILLSHTPECGETCAEGCPVAEMDRQSGQRASHKYEGPRGRRPGSSNLGNVGGTNNGDPFPNGPTYGDVGGASRFFPVFRYQAKASKSDRGTGNVHPTVKPVALMEWLVKLVTPLGGTVLDPFLGSGTTGVAAARLGFSFVGIEREPQYFEICKARIDHASESVVQRNLFVNEVQDDRG